MIMLNANTLQKYTGVNVIITDAAGLVWLRYPHTVCARSRIQR